LPFAIFVVYLSPDLWYQMMYPPNFDPSKKYPLFIQVWVILIWTYKWPFVFYNVTFLKCLFTKAAFIWWFFIYQFKITSIWIYMYKSLPSILVNLLHPCWISIHFLKEIHNSSSLLIKNMPLQAAGIIQFTFFCIALFTINSFKAVLQKIHVSTLKLSDQRWRSPSNVHMSDMYSYKTIQIMQLANIMYSLSSLM